MECLQIGQRKEDMTRNPKDGPKKQGTQQES